MKAKNSMTPKPNRKNQAFSLVELSIVLIVLGLLATSATQGSVLIQKARIFGTKKLTQNSPVVSTPDLVLWLETTDDSYLKTSLFADINSSSFGNLKENDKISSWKSRDIISGKEIETSASADDKRPTYIEKGIGNLPSLSFDGNDALATLLTPLAAAQRQYTLFGVFKNLGGSSWYYIFSQNNGDLSGTNSGTVNHSQASIYIHQRLGFNAQGQGFFSATSFTQRKDYAAAIRVNNDNPQNVSIFTNNQNPELGTTTPVGPDALSLGNGSFSIACRNNEVGPFTGLISEIIIFERDLADKEISDINTYLIQKYKIKN